MNPQVKHSQVFPTIQVGDILTAIDFYVERLGFTHQFSWGEPPTFGGVSLGNSVLHLQTAPSYVNGPSIVNFIIDNADELYAFHQANGVDIIEPIEDRPYGIRDYMTRDPYGNCIGFGSYIYNQGPPVKIERVGVPVRLEKRLAALLDDLAEHKRMSVSSCLEEMLLHSFERIGDTVASPHTLHTLDYIQELKKKHGIDYDTHASYRFVE